MAKLLFVVETFVDVAGGTLGEVWKGELTCIFQNDWTLLIEHPFVYNLWSRFSLTDSLTAAKRFAMLFSIVVAGNQGFHSRRLLMIANKLENWTQIWNGTYVFNIVLTWLLNWSIPRTRDVHSRFQNNRGEVFWISALSICSHSH